MQPFWLINAVVTEHVDNEDKILATLTAAERHQLASLLKVWLLANASRICATHKYQRQNMLSQLFASIKRDQLIKDPLAIHAYAIVFIF